MATLKRLEIREIIESRVNLDGLSLEGVCQLLDEFKQQYSQKYFKIYFDVDYGGEDLPSYLQLIGYRLENDNEYETRIEQRKLFQENKKKEIEDKKNKEYLEYLRLKEKYGSSSTKIQ